MLFAFFRVDWSWSAYIFAFLATKTGHLPVLGKAIASCVGLVVHLPAVISKIGPIWGGEELDWWAGSSWAAAAMRSVCQLGASPRALGLPHFSSSDTSIHIEYGMFLLKMVIYSGEVPSGIYIYIPEHAITVRTPHGPRQRTWPRDWGRTPAACGASLLAGWGCRLPGGRSASAENSVSCGCCESRATTASWLKYRGLSPGAADPSCGMRLAHLTAFCASPIPDNLWEPLGGSVLVRRVWWCPKGHDRWFITLLTTECFIYIYRYHVHHTP